jgi:hypothetical protein
MWSDVAEAAAESATLPLLNIHMLSVSSTS